MSDLSFEENQWDQVWAEPGTSLDIEAQHEIGASHRLNRTERWARGLGWFSIGLGIAQLVAPREVARVIGLGRGRRHRTAMMAIGLRELTAGIGILARPRRQGWLWTRVAGDIMDLALLGVGARSRHANRGRLLAAMGSVAAVTALDVFTGRQLHRATWRGDDTSTSRPLRVIKAITVNAAPDVVYRFWRNFGNLPQFMENLEAVEVVSERRSRWRAKGPAGRTIRWDAEIVQERENQLISWRSEEDAEVRNWGTVRFDPAPGDRGTEVRVDLHYDPPGGAVTATLAKLFGKEPRQQVEADLRRFKQIIEVGEVVNSDASIHRGPHNARPRDNGLRDSRGNDSWTGSMESGRGNGDQR